MEDRKSEAVKQLKDHSEALSRRLQQLLDRQWDGLSERKGRWIVSARQGIEQTMSELLETQTALADLYQAQVASRRAWLERTKAIQDKITALTAHIESIEKHSDLAVEISDLEKEQSGINTEIAELQFKLKQLYSRKQEITTRLAHLQSTVESKTSSFKHELESQKERIQAETQTDTQIQTTQSSASVEIYSREVDAISDQQESAQQEVSALRDGLVVWKDVCLVINELETNLHNQAALLSKSGSLNSTDDTTTVQLDSKEICKQLKSAADRLETHMHLAKTNKWSLLTVAISHELEALNEGMELMGCNSNTD